MEELHNAIKEQNYADRLKASNLTGDEALIRSIQERIPAPKPDQVLSLDQFKESLKLDALEKSYVGRFFLLSARSQIERDWNESKNTFRSCMDALFELRDNQAITHGAAREVLKKFTDEYSKWPIAIRLKSSFEKTGKNLDNPSISSFESFQPLVNALHENFFIAAFEDLLKNDSKLTKLRNIQWYMQLPVEESDFIVYRELGCGAFGVVKAATHRHTGRMFALKAVDRRLLKERNAMKYVKEEFRSLKLLGENPSPFCVSLVYSCVSKYDILLGLPLCTGGDLLFHMRRLPTGFTLKQCQFFAAEILCGIRHLHSLGIIYRDFKPENILFEDTGHCRISDFGLATDLKMTPETRPVDGSKDIQDHAGTPGYWCPPMINKENYSFTASWAGCKYAFDCDWWSYGVTLYELLYGNCPFSESFANGINKTGQIFKDRNEATLKFEIEFESKDGYDVAEDLLRKLLTKDIKERLGGNSPTAAKDIQSHPFFDGINWNILETAKMDPPFVPSKEEVNAQSVQEINDRVHQGRQNVKLEASDNIEGINFKSKWHELCVSDVLDLQERGKLTHIEGSNSSACIIL